MKIAFIGGGQWAAAILAQAAERKAKHHIVVVESPDVDGRCGFKGGLFLRRLLHKSRLLQLIYSWASAGRNVFYATVWKYRLPVIVTKSINNKDFIAKMKSYALDVILVASCAQILRKEILDLPRIGCINCHPSLLPKYRGPNPFYRVLKNRETETGLSFHFMNEAIDAGDIILQGKVSVEPKDNIKSLMEKCAALAHPMTAQLLSIIEDGNISSRPQTDKEATYFPAITLKSADEFYVKELSDEQAGLWDGYIRNSAQYNFFSRSFWLKLLAEATGMKYKIIVCFKDERPLCGCAALVRKSLEGSLFTSGPLSQYSTILLFSGDKQIAESIQPQTQLKQRESLIALSDYIKFRFDWSVLYLHPHFEDEVLLEQNGWDVIRRYTYYLDLRDENRLYAQFDNALRRKIKKCRVEDFCFKEDFDNFAGFYSLWQQTFRRQGIKPPLKQREFVYVYNKLKEKKLSATMCAYDYQGALAAAVIFLVEQRLAYYWASTFNKDYAASGINQALLWRGLRYLSRAGIERFDFVGADIPSIAAYKRHFGGRLVPHWRVMHTSSLRAKVIQGAKGRYKNFRKSF